METDIKDNPVNASVYNVGGAGSRKMQDLPPMAIITLVGSIIACATAFGLDVTNEQKEAIEDLMRNLVVIGGGDYLLRIARNAFNR